MNQSLSQNSLPSPISWVRRLAILTCLVVGLVFALRAATGPAHATSASPSNLVSQLAIEQIQLGQRVVGLNPLREQTQAPAVIDRATWRQIDLETDQGGVKYELSFLRPLSWLEAQGAVEGGTFHLVMREIGVDGSAHVVRVVECPNIEPDDGSGRSLVTGTMSHPAENVLSVAIDGEPEPLGVTTTHPMWSEDQQQFVVAGDLKIGERLRRSDGTLTQVTRITPHTGPPVMVHNLEVDGEHVYCVGDNSLLVHNECTDGPLHHIVTKYDNLHRPHDVVEAIADSKKILNDAGIGMNQTGVGGNLRRIPGHTGPHPDLYHKNVNASLRDAIEGHVPGTSEFRDQVEASLNALRYQIRSGDLPLN